MIRLVCIGLCLIVFSGCGGSASRISDAISMESLDYGAKKSQVESAFGSPKRAHANGRLTVWSYCDTNMVVDELHDLVFIDDKFVYAESYKNSRGSDCTSFFRPIN